MLEKRKLVHSLLIISELLIISAHIVFCVMYGKYTKPDWNKKIWMSSKIKTIENIVKENNNNIYPLLGINADLDNRYKQSYKYLLEHSSTSTCSGN